MCLLQLCYTGQAPLTGRKLSQAQISQQQQPPARIKHVVLGFLWGFFPLDDGLYMFGK